MGERGGGGEGRGGHVRGDVEILLGERGGEGGCHVMFVQEQHRRCGWVRVSVLVEPLTSLRYTSSNNTQNSSKVI